MSATPRVSEIPELVALICGFATRQDCARLSRVCQSLFLSTRPLVWKHVIGAVNLLRLLPTREEEGHVSLEANGAKSNPSRLEIYLPFIQSLEISSLPQEEYRIPDTWRSCIACGRCPIPIPSLRRLTYTSPRGLDESQLDYMAFFLSPAILNIAISGRGGCALWQSLPSVSKLLDSIFHSSPRLQSLRIFPGVLKEEQPFDEYPELVSFTDDRFTIHEQLSRFRCLKTLIISPAVLEPKALYAIGTLPWLEILIIQSTSDGGHAYDEYTLNESSFPALSRLELNLLDPEAIERICSIEPLLARLKHIAIEYGHGEDQHGDDPWGYTGDHGDCLLAVGRICSGLTSLEFDTSRTGYELDVSRSLANAFSLLPIRYLYLIANISGLSAPADWGLLLSALPLVEEFHLPYEHIGHRDLRLFASMLPQLRLLDFLGLEFDNFDTSPTSKDLTKVVSPSVFPVQIKCGSLGLWRLNGQWKIAARFFHALWPNVGMVEPQIFGNSTDHTRLQREIIGRINEFLSKIRKAA